MEEERLRFGEVSAAGGAVDIFGTMDFTSAVLSGWSTMGSRWIIVLS
jgi:hypothetical protein